MNKIKQPIFYLQWTLIVFSIVAFILATIEGFKMSLDLSSNGFQEYLKMFTPYSILFAATFVVLTTHLAIERLGLMNDANNNAFKASNRTIWIQTTKEFLSELKEENPLMLKELSKQLLVIHDYLFEKQYKILSENDTKELFDKFFKNRVQFYEEMNTKYMNIALYRDNRQSYSWDGFRYLIMVMVNADECYPKFILDLRELYQQEVLTFNSSCIDPQAFEFAHKEYIQRKLKGTNLK
ncbi:hypothetical protein [Algoriphagus antarcticus]|uniref:Uncharacterized protein n=1 Tax=Algoriphagus antarcticus TaxID=238540 RepID=A0A3E0DA44_9BACT|nr:hypothetical protein [Algoriphagus antarcticus]REG78408.1 hypothetical protein C8N25_13411 [Algoriphagus antarcticus]